VNDRLLVNGEMGLPSAIISFMKFTNRKDFPKELPSKKTFYCWTCKSTDIDFETHHFQKIICNSCHAVNERVLIFDPALTYKFAEDGTLIHYSVGTFIIDENKRILLFLRQVYPYLYALPAGHLEVGEEPVSAAKKEVLEEVNLKVQNLDLIFEGLVENEPCVGGADVHYWYLYKTYSFEGDIQLDNEGKKWEWMKLEDIDLTKVVTPLKFFLTNKKVLQFIRAGL
jgi:8-oxo-dGTP pyrophosphatase MutT (NUDIX family)